jgi:peptide/nickel transport system ATP-binding protein
MVLPTSAETAKSSNLLLDVQNVCVDYVAANGTVHAVTDVNLTLNRGEILGLAGESGSGKSTLAWAIARLLRPPALVTNGSVIYHPRLNQIDGRKASPFKHPVDILSLGQEQLRQLRWNELSVVFQSAMNALNPVMTIGNQIMDVLATHRPEMGADSRKQRALELLKLVGIAPDRIKSYPHELSGGMRQRATIAIALALNPELIILDEPTTALDVVMQREILMEIMRLREHFGFAVIFITHDLSLLLELADRVAIMYAGRLVEKASRREMYLHPRHPYSYGLLNSFPSLRGPRRKMYGIAGSPPDLRQIPAGCAFHARCPMAFTPCTQQLPQMLIPTTSGEAEPDALVACHHYNQIYRAAPPQTSDIAAAYDALAEREERVAR